MHDHLLETNSLDIVVLDETYPAASLWASSSEMRHNLPSLSAETHQ